MTTRQGPSHVVHHLIPARNLTSDLERLWRVVGALTVVSVAAFAAIALEPVREAVVPLDRTWHGWMIDLHHDGFVAAATVLAGMGSAWVTVPLRVVVSLWLAWRRRWARLTVWLLGIALSEPLIGLLKVAYARERPPLSLEVTRSLSFPSGHAVVGAVIAITLVAVLTRPGTRRWHWWGVAVAFSTSMAMSRTYLRAHWLTDVLAGSLLGATLGLLAVALVASFRRPQGSTPS